MSTACQNNVEQGILKIVYIKEAKGVHWMPILLNALQHSGWWKMGLKSIVTYYKVDRIRKICVLFIYYYYKFKIHYTQIFVYHSRRDNPMKKSSFSIINVLKFLILSALQKKKDRKFCSLIPSERLLLK